MQYDKRVGVYKVCAVFEIAAHISHGISKVYVNVAVSTDDVLIFRVSKRFGGYRFFRKHIVRYRVGLVNVNLRKIRRNGHFCAEDFGILNTEVLHAVGVNRFCASKNYLLVNAVNIDVRLSRCCNALQSRVDARCVVFRSGVAHHDVLVVKCAQNVAIHVSVGCALNNKSRNAAVFKKHLEICQSRRSIDIL